MTTPAANAFQQLPPTPRHHFILHFYAAVYYLMRFLHDLHQENADADGDILDAYPFLSHYLGEMLPHMPPDVSWDDGLAWWQAQLAAWAAAAAADADADGDDCFPLRALDDELDFAHRLALLLVGLAEEDSRFGTLFARLQAPPEARRPSLELVGQIVGGGRGGEQDAWHLCRPLLESGLLTAENQDAPRAEWLLKVPPLLWDVLRGESGARLAGWGRRLPAADFPPLDALIVPEALQTQLAHLPALLQAPARQARAVVLRGARGSDRLQVLGALARALGYHAVIAVDDAGALDDALRRQLGALCRLTRALPVLTYELAPGETAVLPTLAGYRGAVGVLVGAVGGLKGALAETAVTLELPLPDAAQRRRHWLASLAGYPVADLETISRRFHLPGGYIRQVAGLAVAQAQLAGAGPLTAAHVRTACRALNRQLLDTLAEALPAGGSWDQLVVSDVMADKLRELERRCRHREQLLAHLGRAFGSSANRGVRALFTGSSGTGKTLAAKILAAELEMELYRVDLAAVVNKYIGETEKNLHQVLSRAEELDVVLLLDEGDALLGQRTEVKSANDRYANLETNYLLQRLEHYQGIVIVTSNAAGNIDKAFQRRMDVVIHFVLPQAAERWHIWQLHLPPAHALGGAYLEDVAVRCALSGGQIRNAAMHATLLALDEGAALLQERHLAHAIRSEYRKASATCPLDDNGRTARPATNGVEAFLAAVCHNRY
ncbi:MAG: ATP-binding protein [Anaerolineales bacterium]|nr:ATP-binding protein [Anaerolineales bacterium]